MIAAPTMQELGQCAEFYLEDCRAMGESPATLRSKKVQLIKFRAWAATKKIGHLYGINIHVLEEYRKFIHYQVKADGNPLSIRTQYSRLTTITKFIKVMDYYGLIDGKFARKFRLPRIPRRLPRDIPSVTEIEKILSQSLVMGRLGLRNRAIIEVFYATGIRRSELTDLDIGDIDFENRILFVREGKNRNDRNVPIADRALKWISRYLKEQRPRLATLASEDCLFLSNGGLRISPPKVTEMVTKCIQRSGTGKKGSCHLLRHATATEMLRAGADIREIQQMLGHSDITTTQLYLHVTINDLNRVYHATHPAARTPN